MATHGSVASIRKKLMSKLSISDERRTRSPVKTSWTDGLSGRPRGSTTTTKKDWPLHHQTKNDRVDGPQSSDQNSMRETPPLDDITGRGSGQASAPVDLVASCSTHAHNQPATSASADVITSRHSRVSSPIDEDLPWLIRRADDQSDVFSDDGPSSSTLGPDTVVPPPGSVHRHRLQVASTDAGPRRRLHMMATATDKFDERDEEMMSPLSWRPPPASGFTTMTSVYFGSYDDDLRLNNATRRRHNDVISSPYATIGRRHVTRTASLPRPHTDRDNSSVWLPVSPPSAVSQEEDQLNEIGQLRADLDWAQRQVTCLAASLRTNANAVQEFDETLSKMSERLHRLNARHCYSNYDVNELLIAVENLRAENLRVIDDVGEIRPRSTSLHCRAGKWDNSESRSSAACQQLDCERQWSTSRHDSLRRHRNETLPSYHLRHQQLRHQMTSSTASLSDRSSTIARRSSLKTWLSKALSRNKEDSSTTFSRHPTTTSSTSSAVTVTHAASLPSIAPSHNLQSELLYCATVGRPRRRTSFITRHPQSFNCPPPSHSLPLQPISEPPPAVTSSPACSDVTRRGARRTTSLCDPQHTAQSVLDLLVKANSQRQTRDGQTVFISVSVSADVTHDQHHQLMTTGSTEVVIGAYRVLSSTNWSTLDVEIGRIFEEYVRRLEAGQSSLGLNTSSISSYRLAELTRVVGARSPELLPVGYLVGDVDRISVSLRDETDECVDQLSFEALISTSQLTRYMSMLTRYRRLVVCGPSGTGKTYLAVALARSVARRCGYNADSSVSVIRCSPELAESCRESVHQSCQTSLVLVLDDISLSSLHALQLQQSSAYVIATTSHHPDVDWSASPTDDVIVGQFCVVQYVTCSEPVRGFLGRYLRRRLIAQSHLSCPAAAAAVSAGCGAESSQLTRVVDWLPSVWQKVNKFLNVLSQSQQLDITIGPKLFSACPMDVVKSNVWFTDLWNYFIVSYLTEAVTQSRQSSSSSTRSMWQDIAEWIGDSWPWPLSSSQCPPLRVQPTDVGFDEMPPVNSTSATSDETTTDHHDD